MKLLARMIWLLLVCTFIQAQDIREEYYELTQMPWNGDWLEQSKDQLVHGEDYRAYPGPLPKMYAALGLDVDHPGIDFELLELVQRDSPYWFGSCNGWAAAAIQFAEPNHLVVNGVKLFTSEAKAILSSIWKTNSEHRVGVYDSVGLTAQSLEELLYTYTANNRTIIFDVTLGQESWNYPVSAFRKRSFDTEGWTEVELTIFYTNTRSLKNVEKSFGRVFFRELTYTYRISRENPNHYEWVGDSKTVRPHRAWRPSLPYLSGWWFKTANRYFNMALYNQLHELAAREDAVRDLFEPNDSRDTAGSLHENILLASLPQDDQDWFVLNAAKGEAVRLDLEVYDGPEIEASIIDAEGTIVATHENVRELEIVLPTESANTYHIRLAPMKRPDGDTQAVIPSFYHIQFSQNRSWYRHPVLAGAMEDVRLKAVNIGETPNPTTGDEVLVIPPKGSTDFLPRDGSVYRASERAVWAVEGTNDSRAWKKYYRDHPLRMPYTVPHFTFRNGWETRMDIAATLCDEVVWLEVFDKDGVLLQQELITHEMLEGLVPLHAILTESTRTNGAWFQLKTSRVNYLSGVVIFEHKSGLAASYDIEDKPRNGEQVLFGLVPFSKGWTGLSLVNTSGVDNEVLYRLYDEKGRLLTEGAIFLNPGQRWLGLPNTLAGVEIKDNYSLYLFSQYDLESLVLHRDHSRDTIYAHRLMNTTLDKFEIGYLSVSDAVSQSFIFANVDSGSNWILVQAFSADGELQGTIRIDGRALEGGEIFHVTLSELIANENLGGATSPISYFLYDAQRPLYVHELIGLGEQSSKTFVRIPHIFPDP